MTITSVLQNMYTKLSGGLKPKGNTTDEVLLEMVDVIGEGSGSSGGGVLVVNVTESTDEQGEPVYACDKTAGEMAEAYLSGGVVLAVPAEGAGFNDNYFLVIWAEWSADGWYHFHTTIGDEYYADTASDYPATGADNK